VSYPQSIKKIIHIVRLPISTPQASQKSLSNCVLPVQIIQTTQKYIVKEESRRISLIINDVQPEDSGEYMIRAENEFGDASCTTILTIERKYLVCVVPFRYLVFLLSPIGHTPDCNRWTDSTIKIVILNNCRGLSRGFTGFVPLWAAAALSVRYNITQGIGYLCENYLPSPYWIAI